MQWDEWICFGAPNKGRTRDREKRVNRTTALTPAVSPRAPRAPVHKEIRARNQSMPMASLGSEVIGFPSRPRVCTGCGAEVAPEAGRPGSTGEMESNLT